MKTLVLLTTVTAGLNLALISSASAETYGGEATGGIVTVPATGTQIRAATAPLSISGGGEEAALLVGDIPGNLTGGVVSLAAGAMHTGIFGVGTITSAGSSMGDVNLSVSGNQITSDFMTARSKAHCTPGPIVEGSSTLENLVINGTPITVTGAPNQTVTLPNGTAVINEQASSIVGSNGELTVTALHVTTRDAVTGAELADVKLATVDAKHGCVELPPDAETEVEGGGTILGAAGTGKAKFGVFAEMDPGPKGHVVLKDPSVDFSMRSTSIATFTTSGCMAQITGTADTNRGNGVSFTLNVQDFGEPGAGRDTFDITVDSVPPYTNPNTVLLKGDIEVEGPTCPSS